MKIASLHEVGNWLLAIPPVERDKKMFSLYGVAYSPNDIINEIEMNTGVGKYVRSASGFLDYLLKKCKEGEPDIIKNYIRYWVETMPPSMRNEIFVYSKKYGGLTPNKILEEIEDNTPLGRELYEKERYVIKALESIGGF